MRAVKDQSAVRLNLFREAPKKIKFRSGSELAQIF
jgi:hypothetical protein